ncbi:hypothetical protein GCM10027080_10890 [Pedococcus soli]
MRRRYAACAGFAGRRAYPAAMAIERQPSTIAGRGWFTTGGLARGEAVAVDVAALNHSCDPTLAWAADGERVVAFRDVEPGEELTLDYATGSIDPEMVVRCHCETYRCRQLVTGDDWRIPQVQRRYAGHLAPVVQRAVDATA